VHDSFVAGQLELDGVNPRRAATRWLHDTWHAELEEDVSAIPTLRGRAA
jgi:hypothetical protein